MFNRCVETEKKRNLMKSSVKRYPDNKYPFEKEPEITKLYEGSHVIIFTKCDIYLRVFQCEAGLFERNY